MTPSILLECSNCGRLHGDSALVCEVCGAELPKGESFTRPKGVLAIPLETPPKMRASARESFRLLARPAPVSKDYDLRFAALRRMVPYAPRSTAAVATRPSDMQAFTRGSAEPSSTNEFRFEQIEPWLYLVLGLAAVPIFSLTPLLESLGALLSSLVHEMGHASFAFLCGMPAIPEVSLAGHSTALHSDQSLALVGIIGACLVGLAYRTYRGPRRWITMSIVAVAYPAIALTEAKELLHLLAGHLTELACATVCLWATLDGGFTSFKIERVLYGTAGWYLVVRHFQFCCSLMRSAEAQAHYTHKPMFVVTNDYIRAALNILECPLEHVVLAMLLLSFLVLPLAVILRGASRASRALR
jgi:hypothetical protein